ncbi:c-type cytochrome [Phenylobacterium montanum]|uniref:C-type cytochrome n=1 Tax=Phenylobacterium montanum TaxID=2823693 RepID=A0A975IXI1_9CAUL|nr:c-type cytochrome [Caulobacter sp. S6]QUD89431.1 c-type cytochrome [Caulobacter sp. S6]
MARLLILTVLAALAAPLAQAVAGADPGQGRAVFAAQCGVCHSNARSGGVIVGPPLYGVVGRKAGTVAGFDYSQAMKGAGFVWTPDRLHAYLPAPRDYLPGVKMTYAGLKDPNKLDSLIAYLQTLR